MILSRKPFYVGNVGTSLDVRISSALGTNPGTQWDYVLNKKSLDPLVAEELLINVSPFTEMVFSPTPPLTKITSIEVPAVSNHARTRYQLDGVQTMEDAFFGWKSWQYDDVNGGLPFTDVGARTVTADSWQFLELSTVQLGADITWTTDDGQSLSEALPTTVAMVYVPVLPDGLDISNAHYITITDTSGKLSITYKIECQWETDSRTIFFLNGYGVWESFEVVGSEDYISNRESSGSLSYSDGSFIEYSITGTTGLNVNTGWVSFEFKEIINQLMMSENIYTVENDNVIHIYMKNNSFNYKSRRDGNLINHTVQFMYSKPVIPII